MISKSNFIALVKRGNPMITGDEDDFENYGAASDAAARAQMNMPGIGFASIAKRFNAFVAVCRYLDTLMENGEIDLGGTQLAILILRASHKPFIKAAIAFELRAPKLRALDRVELPASAREYLAGIQRYG